MNKHRHLLGQRQILRQKSTSGDGAPLFARRVLLKKMLRLRLMYVLVTPLPALFRMYSYFFHRMRNMRLKLSP